MENEKTYDLEYWSGHVKVVAESLGCDCEVKLSDGTSVFGEESSPGDLLVVLSLKESEICTAISLPKFPWDCVPLRELAQATGAIGAAIGRSVEVLRKGNDRAQLALAQCEADGISEDRTELIIRGTALLQTLAAAIEDMDLPHSCNATVLLVTEFEGGEEARDGAPEAFEGDVVIHVSSRVNESIRETYLVSGGKAENEMQRVSEALEWVKEASAKIKAREIEKAKEIGGVG